MKHFIRITVVNRIDILQTCQLQKFKIGRLWFSTLWKLGDFNQNREIL